MLRTYLTLFVVFHYCLIPALRAQQHEGAFGAIHQSMGGITTVLRAENALFGSFSGLVHHPQTNIATGFANRYGLPNFNTVGLALSHAGKQHGMGFHIVRFGDRIFNQTRLGVGYAHSLDGVSIGIGLNVLQLHIQEAGTWLVPSIDADAQVELTENWVLGAHLINLSQSTFSQDGSAPLPSAIRIGLRYQPIEALGLMLETEKELNSPILLKAGMAYQLSEYVSARMGWVIPQNTFSFGTGLHYQKWALHYALTNHLLIGLQHQVGIVCRLGHDQQKQHDP